MGNPTSSKNKPTLPTVTIHILPPKSVFVYNNRLKRLKTAFFNVKSEDFSCINEAKSLNTSTPSEVMSPMAAKTPRKKKGKRKRKMRLSLRQSKVNMAEDKYSDSLGWSTDVGRTLGDAPKPTGPETIKIQCDMCGSVLKIPKPKKARYTVSCSYPECNHVMKFD